MEDRIDSLDVSVTSADHAVTIDPFIADHIEVLNQATGAPVELEEFLIAFYDFDQDHADHDRAFVRESMLVTDFAAMFITNSSEIEYNFSSAVEQSLGPGGANYMAPPEDYNAFMRYLVSAGIAEENNTGIIPITTFVDWPWSEDRRTSVQRPRGFPAPANCDGGKASWPPMAGGRMCGGQWVGFFAVDPLDPIGLTADEMLRALGQSYNYNPYGNPTTGVTCTMGQTPCAIDYSEAGDWASYTAAPYTRSVARPGLRYAVSQPASGSPVALRTRPGVILRSTRVGLGPPQMPTVHYEGCKGVCSTTGGIAPAGAVNAGSAVAPDFCHMRNYVSSNGNDPRNGCNNLFTWTGCGFTNGAGPFSDGGTTPAYRPLSSDAPYYNSGTGDWEHLYPAAAAYRPMPRVAYCNSEIAYVNPEQAALYDDVVPCVLDCPRTDVMRDFGNPTEAALARFVAQQTDRSATFVFRDRQNFTVAFRTEIGGALMAIMDQVDSGQPTRCPDGWLGDSSATPTECTNYVAGTPYGIRNDLVNADGEWHDYGLANKGPWYRGRSRISGDTRSQAPVDRNRGRNFLISAIDILVPDSLNVSCANMPTACMNDCCAHQVCTDALGACMTARQTVSTSACYVSDPICGAGASGTAASSDSECSGSADSSESEPSGGTPPRPPA